MPYISGLLRAIFQGHGIVAWGSLLAAYIFGTTAYSDYEKYRDAINGLARRSLMPNEPPLWWIVIPFLVWVIVTLAHREAMRYWRAARILIGKPYGVSTPLFHNIRANGVNVGSTVQSYLTIVKVDVCNKPFKSDEGKDVIDAWGEIELFDLNSKPITNWRFPRWEENKQPGYGDHPLDHFPDQENMRTLAANNRPHILCIALKHTGDEYAYPLRGADQLKSDWRADDVKIPRGDYLVRLRIHGKGLQVPSEHILLLENRGTDGGINLSETTKKIETWRRW